MNSSISKYLGDYHKERTSVSCLSFYKMIWFLILSVICLVLWFVKSMASSSSPLLRRYLPLIGYAHMLRGNTTDLWKLLTKVSIRCVKAGGVLKIKAGLGTYYFITDPDDAITVANNCLKKHFSYEFVKGWLGNGLITSSGGIWKRHRKLLSPAFSLQVLHGFIDIFNEQSRKLMGVLAAADGIGGAFDVSLHLRQMALENICLTAFGVSVEEDTKLLSAYAQAVDVILNLVTYRFQNIWMHSDFLYGFTQLKKKEDHILSVINSMTDVIIKRKRAAMQQNAKQSEVAASGLRSRPLLELLLELSDEEALTDNEIREEIDTAIAAALDTSVWALTYTLVLLGSHHDIQEKVFQEIMEVFGKEDRDVTKYDLPKLVYLEAVVKETMRLYTIVPFIMRTADKDVKLKNHTLKTGAHCVIASYGLHRHPCWGPDSEVFRPERWLEPATHGFVFAGFGLTRRTCIGKTYAMMSLKTTLCHMLRRYKVTANENDLQLKLDFVLKPTAGHFISIEQRNLED